MFLLNIDFKLFVTSHSLDYSSKWTSVCYSHPGLLHTFISECSFNVCLSAMDLCSTLGFLLFFLGLHGICTGFTEGELSHTVISTEMLEPRYY